MSAERRIYLLKQAAAAFADNRSPFSTDWLVDHEVTSTECAALSSDIAEAIESAVSNTHSARALLRQYRRERGR